ncbi:MAG: 18 kDa heat shock protein [Verrucomicrobia bacterium ADurb.Bin474]|nr:MAG: 18 kDa heat shock protein [Verrucomicrobia bacterium ADurb.Bin474]
MISRSEKPKTTVSTIIIAILALVVLMQGIWIFRSTLRDQDALEGADPFGADSLFDVFDQSTRSGWMMDPQTWDPHAEMERLQERMDQFLEEAMRRTGQDPRSLFPDEVKMINPRVNMEETDTAFEITVELPGAEHAQIETTLEDQQLTIEADTNIEVENQSIGGNTVIRERRSGRFQRSLILPTPVNAAKMTTTYENGVLHIHVPKAAEDPAFSNP